MTKTNNISNLDSVFEALAHQHRRDIIHSLGLQPHSISQLASQQKLSLPAIHKHIEVLEKANLIIRKKVGRTNFLTLNTKALYSLQKWLLQYQAYWGNNQETLENYTRYLNRKEKK